MASVQQLKTQIENVNALGRTNLSEKGVELPETATTYEIMSKIAEIVSGSGTEYTSIVYNTDNTITLTDTDGVVHTMSCTYENSKLIGVTYDGKAVELTYNCDALVKVGKTAVDLSKVQVSGVGINTENTLSTANELICTFWDNRQTIKTNNGLAIVGQLWNGTHLRIFSVGKTKTAAQFHYANWKDTPNVTYFEYDGMTYCLYSTPILYAQGLATDGVPPIDISKIIPLSDGDTEGKKLLDYYYGKTTLS